MRPCRIRGQPASSCCETRKVLRSSRAAAQPRTETLAPTPRARSRRADFIRGSGALPAELHPGCRKPDKGRRVLTTTRQHVGSRRTDRAGGPVPSAAPIGSEVFEIERRNHYRTRVYAFGCVSGLLDTANPADTLEKSKNGFNFARFDVFSRSSSQLVAQGDGGGRKQLTIFPSFQSDVAESPCSAALERRRGHATGLSDPVARHRSSNPAPGSGDGRLATAIDCRANRDAASLGGRRGLSLRSRSRISEGVVETKSELGGLRPGRDRRSSARYPVRRPTVEARARRAQRESWTPRGMARSSTKRGVERRRGAGGLLGLPAPRVTLGAGARTMRTGDFAAQPLQLSIRRGREIRGRRESRESREKRRGSAAAGRSGRDSG